MADPVHLADGALELGEVLGSRQGRSLALRPPVNRNVAGGAEVERVVLVIVQLLLVRWILVASLVQRIVKNREWCKNIKKN